MEEPRSSPEEETSAERQGTPFLVLQFFIFPLAIVAVSVAVFVVFGLVASEGKGPRDYLAEVRTGGANRRWQAAFELSRVIQAGKDPVLKDPRFVSEMVSLFQDSRNDDPRVGRYLALALGRLGSPEAVPALRAATGGGKAGRQDSETRIFATWALGAIADPVAIPDLARLAREDDAGLRKTAVHSLGAFDTREARDALAVALQDEVEDVRWNAALGLARHGDPRGRPVLLQMLDRGHLAHVAGIRPDQVEAALLQAVAVAPAVSDGAVREALTALEDDDPSLEVRQAAREALAAARP